MSTWVRTCSDVLNVGKHIMQMRGVTLSFKGLVLDFATVESRDVLAMWFSVSPRCSGSLDRVTNLCQTSIFNKPSKHCGVSAYLQPPMGYHY